MDSSQAPRARIPNPNHHISAATQASLGPSTRQPAPQQPHFHRDPFRPPPPPQSDRRDPSAANGLFWSPSGSKASYTPMRLSEHRDTLQPAPLPPPSPFSRNPPFSGDHGRRHSQSGDSMNDSNLPNYAAPPFAKPREMPPPASSPPRTSPTDFNGVLQRAQSQNHYGTLRDPPARQAGRTTNNMSISSVLGSESPSDHRTPQWSPQSRNAGLTSSYQPPASPRQAPPTSSDEIVHGTGLSSPRYGPVFAAPQHNVPAHHESMGSPDQPTHSLSNHLVSSRDASYRTPLPPRPYSQPAGLQQEAMSHAVTSPANVGRDDNLGAPEDRSSSHEHAGYHMGHTRARDRASSDLSPRYTHESLTNRDVAAFSAGKYVQTTDQPAHPWQPSSDLDLGDADRPIASREGPQLPADVVYGPHRLPPSSQIAVQQPGSHRRRFGIPSPADARQSYPGVPEVGPLEDAGSKFSYLDQHLRRTFDDSQAPPHRASLASSYDGARRFERASPLPQAVQGASSRPAGSRRDPSIKSEFTRVFSGLGSGVGSTPVPMAQTGSPTPARLNVGRPNGNDDQIHDRRYRGENGISPVDKRVRRAYDTDSKPESDNDNKKRKAIGHHHHHHHHPLNGNRPHHHHLKSEEGGPNSGAYQRPSSVTPAAAPKSAIGAANVITSRHHHHNAHHHHHTTQHLTTPVPALRRPCVTIKTQPLLHSVSHLPRQHLGSLVYDTVTTLPPSRTTPLFAAFPFKSSHRLIPNFHDKENCTYTLRVPRSFLSDKSREHVCTQRHVWGTDVYTDDSDPLAAAIHSGWIRGSWAPGVDVEMLDLHIGSPAPQESIDDANTSPSAQDNNVLTGPPATGPVGPPPNHDAHITLLLLPPLERYTASTWYGVRSRAWGDTHDGLSYKIHKVEWVNSGSMAPLKEKSASARNRRLREKRQSTTTKLQVSPATANHKMVKMAVDRPP